VIAPVDLVVNVFERTYRRLLDRDALQGLRAQHLYDFRKVHVLISNVDDEDDVRRRAANIEARDVSVSWVRDDLSAALRVAGLSQRHLGDLLWYSAAPLVAMAIPGADWLVYWDADARLQEPHDWITPSVARIDADPAILVANPRWHVPGAVDTLARETLRMDGGFAIGRGFSDQAFLVRRRDLRRRIYRYVAPAAWRYPAAPHGAVFEQRVDAYMRRAGLLRATYLEATYEHNAVGCYYPTSGRSSLRKRALRAGLRMGSLIDHPAFRP
jgi:hypothetical protein